MVSQKQKPICHLPILRKVHRAASNNLFGFYEYKTAKNRFVLYKERQRAPEEMVNMLVHGGTKHNRKKRSVKRNKRRKRKIRRIQIKRKLKSSLSKQKSKFAMAVI